MFLTTAATTTTKACLRITTTTNTVSAAAATVVVAKNARARSSVGASFSGRRQMHLSSSSALAATESEENKGVGEKDDKSRADDEKDHPNLATETTTKTKQKSKGPTPAPKHTRAYGTPMTGYQLEHGARLMAEDSPFASLNLKEAMKVGAAKGVRCRQHVNPLSQKFCKPSETPKWDEIFKDVGKPMTIDVGCGGGRFPLAMAKRFRERNFLGVDVREALVERGEKWGEFAEVSENVAFAAGNCTVSLKPWLEDYNKNNSDKRRGEVELVCVQFPDPHFKRKHWKRRVVQKEMVDALASGLKAGARVFLQSDVKEVAEDMRDKFEKFGNGKFIVDESLHTGNEGVIFEADAPDLSDWEGEEHEGFVPTWYQKGWLKENPLGVPTEREVQTTNEGQPCFRVMLVRT